MKTHCRLFLASNKRLTIHRKTRLIFSHLFFNVSLQLQFMPKSQQKVDIKLSKVCQNHQKLKEWQKFASRFSEIVHKSSSSEDLRKCRRRFKLFVYLLDSLKQGRTSNWILMTPMLAPANSTWVCWLCWLCYVEEIQASFIIWMNCTVMNLCSYSVLFLQTTLM